MSTTHRHRYKNAGLDSSEMRRRREEEGIQIRKQKREQQLTKRRNVVLDNSNTNTMLNNMDNDILQVCFIFGITMTNHKFNSSFSRSPKCIQFQVIFYNQMMV